MTTAQRILEQERRIQSRLKAKQSRDGYRVEYTDCGLWETGGRYIVVIVDQVEAKAEA